MLRRAKEGTYGQIRGGARQDEKRTKGHCVYAIGGWEKGLGRLLEYRQGESGGISQIEGKNTEPNHNIAKKGETDWQRRVRGLLTEGGRDIKFSRRRRRGHKTVRRCEKSRKGGGES